MSFTEAFIKTLCIVSDAQITDEGSLGTYSPQWVYTNSVTLIGSSHLAPSMEISNYRADGEDEVTLGIRVRPSEHEKCPPALDIHSPQQRSSLSQVLFCYSSRIIRTSRRFSRSSKRAAPQSPSQSHLFRYNNYALLYIHNCLALCVVDEASTKCENERRPAAAGLRNYCLNKV